MGIISADNKDSVVDKSKVTREMQKLRSEIQSQSEEQKTKIKGLYFDGRKDKTLTKKQKGDRFYRTDTVEEHICLVEEPGSAYLGHTTPLSGCADDIADSIFEFAQENDVDLRDLQVIGSDGTAVNTGEKGGVIRLIEEKIDKPLQHAICLLHLNELPFRHLLKTLDGATKGPSTFSGPIGTAIQTCENLPLCEFEPITVQWVEEMPGMTDLSTDQQYLLDICSAVSGGVCPLNLSRKKPGPTVQSRWLTTACRVLRLYVSTHQPSEELKHIAAYILKVYAPVWFSIKKEPSITNGARHLWKIIHLSRFLPIHLRDVIDRVIQRNAFFAHPENLLLSLITDQSLDMRSLGWRRIKKARNLRKNKRVRTFVVPNINSNAQHYVDLIDWSSCSLHEPPLTKSISDEELDLNIENKTLAEIPDFPCHTQGVERLVKIVTDAASSVFGASARDGFIKAKLDSRRRIPAFETKRDYKAREEE